MRRLVDKRIFVKSVATLIRLNPLLLSIQSLPFLRVCTVFGVSLCARSSTRDFWPILVTWRLAISTANYLLLVFHFI